MSLICTSTTKDFTLLLRHFRTIWLSLFHDNRYMMRLKQWGIRIQMQHIYLNTHKI